MEQELFRSKAIKDHSSSNELDRLLVVTSPRGWLGLLVLLLVIGAAVTWGFLGSIPILVPGTGMILEDSTPFGIQSPGTGQLVSLRVKVADEVATGQVIGLVSQPQLEAQIKASQTEVSELRRQDRGQTDLENRQLAMTRSMLAKQKQALQKLISEAERNLELQKEQIKAQADLLDQGLIPRQTWIATVQQATSLEQTRLGYQQDLDGLGLKDLQAEMEITTNRQQRMIQIVEGEQRLQELESQINAESEIKSPVRGRVTEIQARLGELIEAGESVVQVQVLREGEDRLFAVIYVPATKGKQVHVGGPAKISPSDVQDERYGYMIGRVESVSEMPVSQTRMLLDIGEQALVTEILDKIGDPYRVVVSFVPDDSTASGYAWSNGRGAPHEIGSGTLSTAQFEVEEDRPITLLLPWLKEKLGL